jgi:hypothetical protein
MYWREPLHHFWVHSILGEFPLLVTKNLFLLFILKILLWKDSLFIPNSNFEI